MQTTSHLQGQVQAMHRAARGMLAAKGARPWTRQEQADYDAILDLAERAQSQIDSVALAQHSSRQIVAAHRSGLELFMRKGLKAATPAEQKAIRAAMSGTGAAQGGYTVSSFLAADVVNQIKDYGAVRRVATQIITDSGANVGIPTSDGTAEVGEQMDENTQTAMLDATFGLAPLFQYKFSSKRIEIPVELLMDSQIDIIAYITQRALTRIGRIQNLRFTTGSGSNQPVGIVTGAGLGKLGLTGQTMTIIYEDLVDLVDSVDNIHTSPLASDSPFGTSPGWMLSPDARKIVRRIKDSSGRPVWMPSYNGTNGAEPSQLLDFPVYINNDMPSPAANARSLLFGNLRSYVVRDSLEFTLFRFDDSSYALNGKVGFLGIARAGGNTTDPNAVKAYQHSAT